MTDRSSQKHRTKAEVLNIIPEILTDGKYKVYNQLRFKDRITIVRIYK